MVAQWHKSLSAVHLACVAARLRNSVFKPRLWQLSFIHSFTAICKAHYVENMESEVLCPLKSVTGRPLEPGLRAPSASEQALGYQMRPAPAQ